jgi:hypothetical protein
MMLWQTCLPNFKRFPAPPKPRLIASRLDPVGNVAEIMEPGRGKVEIADVFAAYAEACEASGKRLFRQTNFQPPLLRYASA